jgi:prolyl-tRNA synthetase
VFLRTTEFLWQEGHTAHATSEEAWEETEQMLDLYADFAEDYLALSVVRGEKPPHERFPGAERTLSIEAMMQDGKALQAGTSHYLGQNFSKAAEIDFTAEDGSREHAYTTSWGVSTRLIGGVVMAHGDDDGLRLPPRVAPSQVVIIPILRDDEDGAVASAAAELRASLEEAEWAGEPIRARVDARDSSPAARRWEWIKRGVPLVVEIGPRDLAQGVVTVTRRDGDLSEREAIETGAFLAGAPDLLGEIQQAYRDDAERLRRERTREDIEDLETLREHFSAEGAGFVACGWNGDPAELEKVEDLGVSLRCVTGEAKPGRRCALSGDEARFEAILAKAY